MTTLHEYSRESVHDDRGAAPVAGDSGRPAGPGSAPDGGSGRSTGDRTPRHLLHRYRWLLSVVVPVLLVALWHLVTAVLGVFAPYQLPSPGQVWDAAVEMSTRGVGTSLAGHIAISTQRVLLGFGFGAIAGLIVGAAVGLSRLTDVLFSGTIGAFRAVPSLGWVPLLILWVGINEDSKVLLVAIGAFFPVYTTVASALRHVDPLLVEAGRAFGLRGVALLRVVQLPAAAPAVIAGLRLALAQAWLFLVAAQLIASSRGLGFLLTDSANNGRVDRIVLSLVTLAVLGKLTDTLIGVGERALARRW